MPDKSRVAVILVNWNTRDLLKQSLDALSQSVRMTPTSPSSCRTPFGDCASATQIVVVDNASTDDSVEMVKSQFPSVRPLCNASNLGFAKANNQGIKATESDHVLLLNPDAFVQPDTVRRLVEFLDNNSEAGAVGPKLLNPDGSLQYSCRAFPTLGAGFFRQTPLGALFPSNRFTRGYLMSDWDHARARPVDWLSGACLMLRRQALNEVGGLDEGFTMYCEDMDLCLRLQQRGWKCFYEPRAVATHAIGQSSNQAQAQMIVERHRSMLRYFLKHHFRGPGILLLPIVALGIMTRGMGALMRLAVNRITEAVRKRSP